MASPADRSTGILVLALLALFGCYPTHKASFPKFEPSRPPPRVTGEPTSPRPPDTQDRGPVRAIPTPVSSKPDPCLASPAVRAYLDALRRAVLARWQALEMPSDGSAHAQFRLVLAASGEVESLSLAAEHPAGVGAHMLDAVSDAQPFGEMPPEATCLAGQALVIHLRLENSNSQP
jgi:hypothetical protein